MSKFLNLFLPAAGGTALVLGAAYGYQTTQYKEAELAMMAEQSATAQTRAAEMSAELTAAQTAAATAIAEATAAAEAAANAPSGTTTVVATVAATVGVTAQGADAPSGVQYDLGRTALPVEVAAWDIDVRPDGLGLPEGSGDVLTGEELFADQCAMCHGDFGEGVDRWPVLSGGHDTLTDDRPVKTIGSYWPYLSTVWDYVNRAMPFGNAQSLSPDEVYAITAYLMYVNDLVDDDFVLSKDNFLEVPLPNEANFYLDDRAEVELAALSVEPCMTNCKDTVEIIGRAAVVDVTPEDAAARAAVEAAKANAGDEEATSEEAPAEEQSSDAGGVDTAALIEAGAKVYRKCKACHQIGEGASNKTGPHLNELFGRVAGSIDGFGYSSAFQQAQADGLVWDAETLAGFLAKPKAYISGTKMSFAGIRKEEDIIALLAYLKEAGGQ